jgi:hypothetical protein
VFINCPFDDEYAPIFEALIFAVYACEFRPRSARELEDGTQSRLDKLYRIIEECRYGIHDLSRTELDKKNKLPRFNMPLELGFFLAAKRYGGKYQAEKKCLVLDIKPYRYQMFISDLNGIDPQAHANDPLRAIACTRNWLANVSGRKLPGAKLLAGAYKRFLKAKMATVKSEGFDPNEIPYVDFGAIVTEWLLSASKRG